VSVCTKFTDDDKVFAVLGNLGDAAQDAAIHTCIAKKHKTPVITFTLTQDMINQVPPGMMIFPGTTPERSSAVLFELLKKAGKLDGKKVAVLAQSTSEPSVKSVVIPAMKKVGVDMGTPAYLTINGPDTTAAQAQLDSFIERWKSEGVNALFITGQNTVAKQFVEKVAREMPGVMLMTDTGDALFQGQDETKAGANPNPYEGMYLAGGYRAEDYAKSDNWKYCADIYKAQTGKTAPSPTADIKVNVGGKELQDQTYNLINDACQMISTFTQIVAKTGQYPNADNWVSAVNSFGPIVNRGGGPYASLRQGKYDDDDTFQLQQFDSKLPPNGNWAALGEYQNLSS
jgi:ABC-type branched-subunit amino acid transport system substrate-binding protein